MIKNLSPRLSGYKVAIANICALAAVFVALIAATSTTSIAAATATSTIYNLVEHVHQWLGRIKRACLGLDLDMHLLRRLQCQTEARAGTLAIAQILDAIALGQCRVEVDALARCHNARHVLDQAVHCGNNLQCRPRSVKVANVS